MNNNDIYAHELTTGLIFILSIACGSIVANIYYSQTLVVLIGNYLHLNIQLTGLIVTLTQIGYCTGLLFIVPLADIIENRKLIVGLLCLTCLSLLSIVFAPTSMIFLICCFVLGLTAVAAQIIIPLAAHFTPYEKRGKVVGNIMCGLLLGVMLARPMASWMADTFTWQAIFIFSAILMLLLALFLYYLLPTRIPEHTVSYVKLICSLPLIFLAYSALRRRTVYQAMLFGMFSLFWTSIAMLLMGDSYHYSQSHVAIFALAGAIGALAAPIAGIVADRGWTKPATGICIIMVFSAFMLAKLYSTHFVVVLIAALLLDAGTSFNLVLGQRTIYALAPEIRGRLNGLYMALFFIGGSIGSGLSAYLYAQGGWNYITNAGTIISILTFFYFLSEYWPHNNI